MLKFKFINLLFFLFFSSFGLGQPDTYLNYELGIPKDKIIFNSINSNIKSDVEDIVVVGFTLTQQLYKSIYLESGGYLDFFAIDMYDKQETETVLIFNQNQIHIPIRIHFRQSIISEDINLSFTTGLNFVVAWFETATFRLFENPNQFDLTIDQYKFKVNYTLWEIGLGTDYNISDNFHVGARFRYNISTNNILNIEAITINRSDEIVADYNIKSDGSYSSISIAIGYRINSLWE